ncbi:unnamed protein product, partial [Soboliphyme baturini]|uniref:Dehydrogenase/reductase SDR family member on chromosome X n=1 Tax=Soboliphyme baturini TaxID=241478 RepID=A0A183ILL5_9BILA
AFPDLLDLVVDKYSATTYYVKLCSPYFSAARPGMAEQDVISPEYLSPKCEADYSWIYSYNASKMCNIMFAFALNRQLEKKKVFCTAVHPGNLLRTPLMNRSYVWRFFSTICRPFAKSLVACSTVLYAAFAPEMQNVGGRYLNNCWYCNPWSICAFESIEFMALSNAFHEHGINHVYVLWRS